MILTGSEIARTVRRGEIVIKPFVKDNLEPNSYRVTLGDGLLVSTADDLDARKIPQMRRDVIPTSGYILEPGELHLGETAEILGLTRSSRRSTRHDQSPRWEYGLTSAHH